MVEWSDCHLECQAILINGQVMHDMPNLSHSKLLTDYGDQRSACWLITPL